VRDGFEGSAKIDSTFSGRMGTFYWTLSFGPENKHRSSIKNNVRSVKMETDLRPNKAELEFLTIAYNRFYDIFEEVMGDPFWDKDQWYRFSKVKDGFAVYSELLNYEPVKWVIDSVKKPRPPMEAEIGSELFKFIRNVIMHFPFFDSWNEVWVSQSIINGTKMLSLLISSYENTREGRL